MNLVITVDSELLERVINAPSGQKLLTAEYSLRDLGGTPVVLCLAQYDYRQMLAEQAALDLRANALTPAAVAEKQAVLDLDILAFDAFKTVWNIANPDAII